MRRTKIICTMGPCEENEDILKRLCKTMDVARFNFSHGTRESHLEMLQKVRKAAAEVGRPIATMMDTKGPEIRTGLLKNHKPISLTAGHSIILTTEECVGTKEKVYIHYPDMVKDLAPGHRILVDDGLLEFKVEEVNGPDISCRIMNSGELGERKGVNIPDIPIRLPALTDKDRDDIRFAMECGFDFIAASFVRDGNCIREIRQMLTKADSKIKIIAKIECQEGVARFDDIVAEADGIMVARGDLGVEVDPKKLPQLQKEFIKKSNYQGKIVITATQMLDSMIRKPRPTRAEVTDVANAINDGTDALMLSGETANGKYPVEAAEMMASIAEYTEQFQEHNLFRYRDMAQDVYDSVSNTTCRAAVTAAHELHAGAIIAHTITGNTALLLSKYRPDVPVFAFSPKDMAVRQMMLLWGVHPILSTHHPSTKTLFQRSLDFMKKAGHLKEDDLCVVTAGIMTDKMRRLKTSATNMIRIMQA